MNFSPSYGLTAIAAAAMISTSTSAFAGGAGWTTDFAQAQATAQAENKDLMVEYTGSDWCPPCMKMAETVFSHDSFAELVQDQFVLVELDFPNGPQDDELKAQNRSLADRYQVTGFPTVLLLDDAGQPYAKTGYMDEATPESYAEHLGELRETRIERDANFAAAQESEGLEKARFLHDGLQAMGDEVAMTYYADVIEEVMVLDADNEAGVKGHYDALFLAKEQRAALRAVMSSAGDVRGNPQGVIDAIDEFLTDDALMTEVRQDAMAQQFMILLRVVEDRVAAQAMLERAIALDPDTEIGQQLAGALERFFGEDSE